MEYGLLQKAMAFRVKYRLNPTKAKQLIPLRSMGVSQMNRGTPEIYPNGIDVKTLGLEIFKSTCDEAEANHNGVCVEEVPPEVRGGPGFRDPWTKLPYEGIGKYNLDKVSAAEYLSTCFDEIGARLICFGTLSHSHLLLVLLCAVTRAKWDVNDPNGKPMFPCDPEGRLDRHGRSRGQGPCFCRNRKGGPGNGGLELQDLH